MTLDMYLADRDSKIVDTKLVPGRFFVVGIVLFC